jgi:uncharacterized protein YndB with AHSA1/START domain
MDLHFQRIYKASPDRVWWALTDPTALETWYMKAEGLQATKGCTFTLHDADAKGWSGWLDCEVLIATPKQLFKYRSVERKDQLVTDVTWTLTEHADGTHLRLDHTGFHGLNGIIAGSMLRFGWRSLLKSKFAALVETTPPRSQID